jgi:hypothetical protein
VGFFYLIYGDRRTRHKGARVARGRRSTKSRDSWPKPAIGNVLTSRWRECADKTWPRAGEYKFDRTARRTRFWWRWSPAVQVATWVTIPEGFTAAQIAGRLHAEGVGEAGPFAREFLDAASLLTARDQEPRGLSRAPIRSADATPGQVADTLIAEFFKSCPACRAARARFICNHPAGGDDCVLGGARGASEPDRPQIAAVIYNRCAWACPSGRRGHRIRAAAIKRRLIRRLKLTRPYNTYTHPGLPPTPTTRAAVAEAAPIRRRVEYFTTSTAMGVTAFSRTLAQHQANVARCL